MYYYPRYYDASMLLMIPCLIIAFYAQAKVKSTYAKYSAIASSRGITGAQAAMTLLRQYGINDVRVAMISGALSDNYDPRKKILNLSENVYSSASLAALAVAAHETGHAVQHHEQYLPLTIRSAIVPVVQFGSALAMPLCIMGMFFGIFFVHIGIALFAAVVLFQLVTLPVEFNASSRAIAMLESNGLITSAEVKGTKSVLDAAALTYVAALLSGIMQLIRLWLIYGQRQSRRR